MSRGVPRRCQICGQYATRAQLTQLGYHRGVCLEKRRERSRQAMIDKSGRDFDRWAEGLRKAGGGD